MTQNGTRIANDGTGVGPSPESDAGPGTDKPRPSELGEPSRTAREKGNAASVPSALNREGRSRRTGPAFPTSLVVSPSTLGYAARCGHARTSYPPGSDISCMPTARTPAGSTGRPDGHSQPVNPTLPRHAQDRGIGATSAVGFLWGGR